MVPLRRVQFESGSEIAVIGAGVAGLTCGILLAKAGARVRLYAEETGARTTSAAAGAIWFPYDVEPLERVLPWALATFETLRGLARVPGTGVRLLELRCFARAGEIAVPSWARQLGARCLTSSDCALHGFASGYALEVPMIDTGIYLAWLTDELLAAGGRIEGGIRFARLEEVPRKHPLLVNCAGVGARELVPDREVEPHRGQVVLVAKYPLAYAIVCDDPPLMYAFPRTHDCVLGGTNELSADRTPRPAERASILEACAQVLRWPAPPAILGERVGLRPFRRTGVRLERASLGDGRAVIHNYGHGGCGFTLSWGCAAEAVELAG